MANNVGLSISIAGETGNFYYCQLLLKPNLELIIYYVCRSETLFTCPYLPFYGLLLGFVVVRFVLFLDEKWVLFFFQKLGGSLMHFLVYIGLSVNPIELGASHFYK